MLLVLLRLKEPKKSEQAIALLDRYVGDSGRIISLGAGFCHFEVLFSKLGYDVVAVDHIYDPVYESDDHERIRENVREYCSANGVKFICEDVFEIFPDSVTENSFDAVPALDVIEHIHRPQEFLGVAKTILQPDGHLLPSTPNGVNLYKRLKMILGRPYGVPVEVINREGEFTSPIKEYTNSELQQLLALNDFDTIESKFYNQLSDEAVAQSGSLKLRLLKLGYDPATKYFPHLQDNQMVVATPTGNNAG